MKLVLKDPPRPRPPIASIAEYMKTNPARGLASVVTALDYSLKKDIGSDTILNFIHMPKTAGQSMHVLLVRSLFQCNSKEECKKISETSSKV